MFIFYIYRRTFQGVLYQRSFNVSLVAICMIVTLIIMTISGNLVLSLGMVGALSIVRFRTPIKDPVDLVFIFWAITAGIANGVGYFSISIIGSIAVTLVLVIMNRMNHDQVPYLLVMHLKEDADLAELKTGLRSKVERFRMQSETFSGDYVELTAELKLKNDDTSFLKTLRERADVNKVTLLSHSGDLTQA